MNSELSLWIIAKSWVGLIRNMDHILRFQIDKINAIKYRAYMYKEIRSILLAVSNDVVAY